MVAQQDRGALAVQRVRDRVQCGVIDGLQGFGAMQSIDKLVEGRLPPRAGFRRALLLLEVAISKALSFLRVVSLPFRLREFAGGLPQRGDQLIGFGDTRSKRRNRLALNEAGRSCRRHPDRMRDLARQPACQQRGQQDCADRPQAEEKIALPERRLGHIQRHVYGDLPFGDI